MEYYIREIGNNHYASVRILEGDVSIDFGLLGEKERRALAEELQSAIDDLLRGLPRMFSYAGDGERK